MERMNGNALNPDTYFILSQYTVNFNDAFQSFCAFYHLNQGYVLFLFLLLLLLNN